MKKTKQNKNPILCHFYIFGGNLLHTGFCAATPPGKVKWN